MTAPTRRKKAAPATKSPFRKPRTTAGPHFEGFAREFCRHTKGEWAGKPLDFERFQSEKWAEALELDKTGHRVYSFVLDGRPRKNYKSTECAAAALYFAGPDGENEPDVFLGAGAREQAEVVFGQARSMVESEHSRLSDFYVARQTVIKYPASNGSIRKVSADGFLAHGLNPHAVVLDELHAFRSQGQVELYRAMTTGHALRRDPFITSITTAGYEKATILGELYDAALKLGDVHRYGKHGCLVVARDREAGFLMVWYGAPPNADIENREIWRECNPAAGVSLGFLEQQWKSPVLTTNDFCRLHLNMWTASKERWIGDEMWDATRSDDEIPRGARIYAAVDASITYDTTAVSWSWNEGVVGDSRSIERTRVWSTREDVPHDVFVPGGRIDFEEIEDFIVKDLAQEYALQELVYDPRFFEDTANRLSKKGVRIAPFQQGSALMYDAVQKFYNDVKDERIRSAAGRKGQVLADHVKATAAVATERGYKLQKLKSARPIDATVASVMAHSRSSGGAATSAYETRDLLVLGEADEHAEDEEDY